MTSAIFRAPRPDIVFKFPINTFLVVQSLGCATLAYFIVDTIGQAGGRLNVPWLWAMLLIIGSAMSLIQAVLWHNQWTWSIAGTAISVGMLGRAVDIWINYDQFVGRPALAIAIWATMAIWTFVSWFVIGALAGSKNGN